MTMMALLAMTSSKQSVLQTRNNYHARFMVSIGIFQSFVKLL
jgi:hypothetical protein